MPISGAGVAGGYLDFLQNQQQNQDRDLQRRQIVQAMQYQQWQQQQAQEQQKRQMAARAAAGQVLMGQPPPQGMPQPPMPGQSSAPPPGGMPPGQMGPPTSAMMPPPQAGGGATPPQGWKPMPQAGGAPPGGAMPPPGSGGGGMPPPPAAAPPGSDGGVEQPKPLNMQGIISSLKQQGIPSDKIMDVMDELTPIMTAQNKAELDFYKTVSTAQDRLLSIKNAENKTAETARENAAKDADRDAKNQIARQRLQATAGKGGFKITRWATDENGNVIGGYDHAGHFHKVDDTAPKSNPKGDVEGSKKLAALHSDRTAAIAESDTAKEAQIDAEIAALDKSKGGAAKPAGGADVQAKLKAAGIPYEPDKYEYRVNEQGEIQRKPVGQ